MNDGHPFRAAWAFSSAAAPMLAAVHPVWTGEAWPDESMVVLGAVMLLLFAGSLPASVLTRTWAETVLALGWLMMTALGAGVGLIGLTIEPPSPETMPVAAWLAAVIGAGIQFPVLWHRMAIAPQPRSNLTARIQR